MSLDYLFGIYLLAIGPALEPVRDNPLKSIRFTHHSPRSAPSHSSGRGRATNRRAILAVCG